MQTPLLLVNCKNYGPKTGELAIDIAKAAAAVTQERKAAGKKDVTIAIAVPATDISSVAHTGLTPVFAEHIDADKPGARTGKVIVENVKAAGAVGSLVNHSEDPVSAQTVKAVVARAKEAGLLTVVCAKDDATSAALAAYEPSFIAMEPPELIGGNISVSTAQPELISKTVAAVKAVADIPILIGAGVKNAQDVRVGVQLGAVGILVASGVTNNNDKKAAITDLANGFD